ncbi:type II toxin-antitoxin system RelE/ParE family toxin [Solimonas sp. K1W22B-7]|uniref:type II toxin-antitoxin system RelE/ParE family toxin n=1 Tax=Solimonas sp. K1W22B-7 TaxID=2303331 RepID=UPI000E335D4E|nr:type II toxin-antitoxin system RelE/ParE family toxin [Solimonas sp. K1W22B-7]AXQ28336.1 type II toxin-antitoxin system RelE/ParE family toxin [Solimonas sp. K1W22B-7]
MTPKPVVPRELANRDVENAIDHYLSEGAAEAALGFIAELERAYSHLERHPATGSSRYAFEMDLPGLRSWPLRRYPFLVFYREQDDHLDVWRVLDARADIPAWLQDDKESAPE